MALIKDAKIADKTDSFYKILKDSKLPLKLEIRLKVFWLEVIKISKKIGMPTVTKYPGGVVFDWYNGSEDRSGVTFDFTPDKCWWTCYKQVGYCEESTTGSVSKPISLLNIPEIKDFFKKYKPMQN